MTILTRNPVNPNLVHPNKFQLNFSRLPNLQYFCQGVTVPGISTNEIARVSPFVELYSPGNKAVYDTLTITFLVDEELVAWKEVHDWIRAMTFPTEFEEYVNLDTLARPSVRPNFPQFSDAKLTILSSANVPIRTFNFIDAFPVSLTSFPLSATLSPDIPVTADATFRYSYFNIE